MKIRKAVFIIISVICFVFVGNLASAEDYYENETEETVEVKPIIGIRRTSQNKEGMTKKEKINKRIKKTKRKVLKTKEALNNAKSQLLEYRKVKNATDESGTVFVEGVQGDGLFEQVASFDGYFKKIVHYGNANQTFPGAQVTQPSLTLAFDEVNADTGNTSPNIDLDIDSNKDTENDAVHKPDDGADKLNDGSNKESDDESNDIPGDILNDNSNNLPDNDSNNASSDVLEESLNNTSNNASNNILNNVSNKASNNISSKSLGDASENNASHPLNNHSNDSNNRANRNSQNDSQNNSYKCGSKKININSKINSGIVLNVGPHIGSNIGFKHGADISEKNKITLLQVSGMDVVDIRTYLNNAMAQKRKTVLGLRMKLKKECAKLQSLKKKSKKIVTADIVFNANDVTEVSHISKTKMRKVLKGTALERYADTYVEIEKRYGINAIAFCALSALESGWGESRRAVEDNNYTGYGVYSDSSKGINAGSAEENLWMTAKCLAKSYLHEGDVYYHGRSLGGLNKSYSGAATWACEIETIGSQLMDEMV